MNFLDRLERRFGNWNIPQLALFIVGANAAIYVLSQIRPEFIGQLVLDPVAIRHGEFWRLITFLFVPPRMGLLWMFFWLVVFYQFSLALEQEWGDFRFLLFYAIGGLSTILAALFVVQDTLSNLPLNTTLFLAFATLFPDYEILLFFILPVKVKYLALVTWIWLAISFALSPFSGRVAIVAALVNYVIFFGPQIWENVKLRIEVYRNRRRFKQ